MALQDEILKALAMGFNTNMPIYNQEIPTNVMTGKPYFQAQAPAPNFNVKPNLGKQISPALAVSQAIGGPVGNVDNQPQFNSREAMNSYNYKPASRNADEGIQDYVKRLISAPTGVGQLSEQFMNSWAAANKALPQSPSEPVDTVAPSGGNGGGGDISTILKMEGFNGFIPRKETPLNPGIPKPTTNPTESSGPETNEIDTLPYANGVNDSFDELAAMASTGAGKRAEQEEAERLKREELEKEAKRRALEFLASSGF